jgi:hypothetical protein
MNEGAELTTPKNVEFDVKSLSKMDEGAELTTPKKK